MVLIDSRKVTERKIGRLSLRVFEGMGSLGSSEVGGRGLLRGGYHSLESDWVMFPGEDSGCSGAWFGGAAFGGGTGHPGRLADDE